MESVFPLLISINSYGPHRSRRTQHWPQRRVPSFARDAVHFPKRRFWLTSGCRRLTRNLNFTSRNSRFSSPAHAGCWDCFTQTVSDYATVAYANEPLFNCGLDLSCWL